MAAAARYTRALHGRMLGGVAAGLANHLEVPVLWVRLALLGSVALGGFGVFVYLALWILAPEEQAGGPAAPGLAAAARAGKRPATRRRGSLPEDPGQLIALAVLGLGLLLLVQQVGIGVDSRLFWPLLAVAAGVAVVWQTSDSTTRRQASESAPWAPWAATFMGGGSLAVAVRLVAGVALVATGLVLYLFGQGELRATLDGLTGTAVLLLGVGLLIGPWLWRQSRALSAERRERLLSQHRADVAAHLHDSVLQTLALIQKQAHDPRAVTRLARSQERDLRTWLYGSAQPPERSVRAALQGMSAEVEDMHGVPVEIVVVGEAEMSEPAAALVAATREAVVNAAKHSGAKVVDVFAEVDERAIEVFVRDRGVGFRLEEIPEDRLGIRGSIQRRIERHGGAATITSAPAAGTEVRLTVPIGAAARR